MKTTELPRLRNQQFLPQTALEVFEHRLAEPFAVHWHEFYELAFVRHGAGTHILNGSAYRLSRGSMFLLTPADFHELVPDRAAPLELFDVVFGDELLGDELGELLFNRARTHTAELRGAAVGAMEAEFQRLVHETSARELGYQQAIYATTRRILVDLARLCGVESAADAARATNGQRPMQRALTFIHHQFRTQLTLEQAAAHAHLSPNYFSELFHQATGTPFKRYVQELRLRFAMAMLWGSRVPVTEICFAAGFSTLSHFERAFKRRFGQTPRAFRKAAPP